MLFLQTERLWLRNVEEKDAACLTFANSGFSAYHRKENHENRCHYR